MEDIIEFANENLEGELVHDLLSYNADGNRAISSTNSRDWETSGISHLLNSSVSNNVTMVNSAGESSDAGFPSSSSSQPPFTNENAAAVANGGSSSSSRTSRRKRSLIDPLNKKPRIDYKTPFHAERLNTAIDAVITALRGDPGAFHRNITLIAKSHEIPYNTLRDNVLRARGIEPRAHRNSERKRQAEAVAAAAERGVEYKAPKSTLQLQTVRVSILIGDALADSPHRFDGSVKNIMTNGNQAGIVHSTPGTPVPSSLDYGKDILPDEKIKIEEIDDIIPSTISNSVSNFDGDSTLFPKFLPLEIVRDDSSDSEKEIEGLA